MKQEVRTLLQAYRKLLMSLLGAAAERGQVPADLDREAAATLFVGIVQGLVMQSMLSGKPGTLKAQADRVFAIYLGASARRHEAQILMSRRVGLSLLGILLIAALAFVVMRSARWRRPA